MPTADQPVTYIAAFILGYAIGAAPIIYFVARARGINLKTAGTGNIGAGNLWRQAGLPIGVLSIFIEVGKGTVAALLAVALLQDESREWILAAGGIGAVVGQMWPATLRFQGGRGNGTAAGALIAFNPLIFAIGFSAFLLLAVRKVTQNVLPGGKDRERSRTVPIAVIAGMTIYMVAGLILGEYVSAIACALILGLTFLRRATATWPPDPDTGLPPDRSLLATLLYDRPDFGR